MQELASFDSLEDSIGLVQTGLSRGPIIAQPKVIRGECSSHQLEHIESDPAGIDLLEDYTHRFLWCFFFELDDGQLIVDERIYNLILELLAETDYVTFRMWSIRTLPVTHVPEHPIHTIE